MAVYRRNFSDGGHAFLPLRCYRNRIAQCSDWPGGGSFYARVRHRFRYSCVEIPTTAHIKQAEKIHRHRNAARVGLGEIMSIEALEWKIQPPGRLDLTRQIEARRTTIASSVKIKPRVGAASNFESSFR